MVKKAKTNKPKPTTVKPDDVFVGVKKSELAQLHSLLEHQTQAITEISAQRDRFKQQRNQITEQIMDVQKQRDQARKACELSEERETKKDDLFYSMCELRQLSELESEALEKELAKSEKKIKMWKFISLCLFSFTLATVMFAKFIH